MCWTKKGEILFRMVVCRDGACPVSTGNPQHYNQLLNDICNNLSNFVVIRNKKNVLNSQNK